MCFYLSRTLSSACAPLAVLPPDVTTRSCVAGLSSSFSVLSCCTSTSTCLYYFTTTSDVSLCSDNLPFKFLFTTFYLFRVATTCLFFQWPWPTYFQALLSLRHYLPFSSYPYPECPLLLLSSSKDERRHFILFSNGFLFTVMFQDLISNQSIEHRHNLALQCSTSKGPHPAALSPNLCLGSWPIAFLNTALLTFTTSLVLRVSFLLHLRNTSSRLDRGKGNEMYSFFQIYCMSTSEIHLDVVILSYSSLRCNTKFFP